MTGAVQAIGWTLLVSVIQTGIIAAVVWLALRVLSPVRAGLRYVIALGGLVVAAAAFVTTAGLLLADWRTHVDCWERAGIPGARAPVECRSHGLPAAAVQATEEGQGKIAAVLAWAPGAWVPVVPYSRALARVWTEVAGVAGALWLAAMLLLVVREVRSRRFLRRVLAESRPVRDRGALAALAELSAQLGIRIPVGLRESAEVTTPSVAGSVRPVILLPEGLLGALGPFDLRGVLAHELAHVRRRDAASTALQRAAELALFLNPFATWISRRVRAEREAACDQVGAALGARSRPVYAEMLLILEGFRSAAGARPALPLLGESDLFSRVQRLLETPVRRGSGRGAVLLFVFLAILSGVLLARASLAVTALGSWAVMTEDVERREARID